MTADMVERLSSLKESITLPSQCKRPNDQKYNTFDRIYYRKMTWNLINSHVDLHGFLSVSMHFKKDDEKKREKRPDLTTLFKVQPRYRILAQPGKHIPSRIYSKPSILVRHHRTRFYRRRAQ